MGAVKDMKGFQFNGCEVLRKAHQNKESKYYWECKCFCGKKFLALGTLIRKGNIKSCGCYKKAILKKQNIANQKHMGSQSRLYRTWINMKIRCYTISDARYKNYGARGIRVCDEWVESFSNFQKWALENGYNDKLTIDRIDNDGDYKPSNCRWADIKTQSRNRRTNIIRFYKGKYRTIVEIAEIKNCSKDKLYYRVKHNLPIDMEDNQ